MVVRLWLDGPVAADRPPFLGTSGYGPLDNVSVLERFEEGAARWSAGRAGASVVELHAYACDPGATVAARIHAIGGTEDPFIKPRDLYGWSRHSTQDVDVTVFDGGHFYLNDNAVDIAELLVPATSANR